ncbi:MAG: hypothetical protein N3E50_09385 [Candidatus Goldbacteria bacterium]|nr:hypothetical protein [Candidatus Goldiibacteriota bacterium]
MKLKKYYFLFLFFLFHVLCKSGCPCSGSMVGGSYLRVMQLGYGWLIPDEQVDAIYNPATLNDIIGNRFFSGFYGNMYYDYELNKYDKYFNSNFFWVLPFNEIKIAVKYSPEIKTLKRKTAYYMSNSSVDNFEFLSFVGFHPIENIKLGLSFGVNTFYDFILDDYYSSTNDTFNKTIAENYLVNTGVVFNINNYFNLGFSFGSSLGTSKKTNNGLITQDNDLKLYGYILPEFKIKKNSETMLFRTLLSVSYESILTDYENELYPDNVERYYNLGSEIGAALYYELKDKTILTCGLKSDWTIKNIIRSFGIGVVDTQSHDGFELTVFAGLEKPVIVDWIILRTGYKIIKIYDKNYIFKREIWGYHIYKIPANRFKIEIFPDFTENFSFGIGVKLGNNIILNMDLGDMSYEILTTEIEKYKVKMQINAEINFIFE